MSDKIPLITGALAGAIFWCALLMFGALRPEYSHFNQAVSELGFFGAPNALAWNLIGFITPGVLVSICGATIALKLGKRRDSLYWLFVISGLGFAGAGALPAEMPNGSPDMESYWTIGHLLMTFVSAIPWVIAAFLLAHRARKLISNSSIVIATYALALFAVSGLLPNAIAPSISFLAENPGLGQRTGFAIYFIWFLVAGVLFTSVKLESRDGAT